MSTNRVVDFLITLLQHFLENGGCRGGGVLDGRDGREAGEGGVYVEEEGTFADGGGVSAAPPTGGGVAFEVVVMGHLVDWKRNRDDGLRFVFQELDKEGREGLLEKEIKRQDLYGGSVWEYLYNG